MPRLPDLELSTLPKIAASAIGLLWVNDWYDGPLEAVVEYLGDTCLMMLHHEDVTAERPYTWVLFRLTAEQLADEEKWHALFAEHVGEHWCFHSELVASHPPPPSREPDPERFYEAYRTRNAPELLADAAVGWTDDMPKR